VLRARHAVQASPLVVPAAVLGAVWAEVSLPRLSGAAVLFAADVAVLPAWRGRVLQVRPQPGLAPAALPALKAAVLLDQKGMVGR
jgi:hypothetical protein